MKICIPVIEDKGLKSRVCEHFGSAPLFLIVDTDSNELNAIQNQNLHHAHGMCQPLKALAGTNVEGVVVGGIGMGALVKLQAANIKVYLSEKPTVEETIAALKSGGLREVTPETACGHHGQESGHHFGQGDGRGSQ
ncbi:MAG: NifB/NifX family molybdenum-iron cluster-binding protein [Phycisphaerae bacterium]|nr:NifB/NifX family molybdenum-iron cluster-binding protein [Phycisphaerae bacterium]